MNLLPISFNLADTMRYAEAASQAYETCTVESSLAHVLIIETPVVRIVEFRGTHNPLDWLTDGKVRMVEYCGLDVHSGFNASMLSVRDALIAELISRTNKPTMIGGHSKGAAEARQFILGLTPDECAEINFASSYTFGEPRSLGRAAAAAYDKRFGQVTFRVIHEEDFVARIPWMMGRYRHAGQEVFLPSTGGININPPLLFKFVSDVYGLFSAWNARRVIGICDDVLKDHFIANYCDAIRKLSPLLQLATPP